MLKHTPLGIKLPKLLPTIRSTIFSCITVSQDEYTMVVVVSFRTPYSNNSSDCPEPKAQERHLIILRITVKLSVSMVPYLVCSVHYQNNTSHDKKTASQNVFMRKIAPHTSDLAFHLSSWCSDDQQDYRSTYCLIPWYFDKSTPIDLTLPTGRKWCKALMKLSWRTPEIQQTTKNNNTIKRFEALCLTLETVSWFETYLTEAFQAR